MCVDQLAVALDQANQFEIESRVVGAGLLLAAAGAAIVGLGLKVMNEPQPQLAHFHLESSDIAVIQSTTDDAAVVATTAGASDHITVNIAPTSSATIEPATVTTLSADADGHHKGDVLIALPSQLADLLEQAVRRYGDLDSCKSEAQSKIKRQSGNGPNFNGINNLATFVLPIAAPGQLLQGLGLQLLDHLPQLEGNFHSP